jgi:hypothetical protein
MNACPRQGGNRLNWNDFQEPDDPRYPRPSLPFLGPSAPAQRDSSAPYGALAGDVIGVVRMGYEHIGVYVGDGQVVHFASLSSDKGAENTVIETPMAVFLRENRTYFVVLFHSNYCHRSAEVVRRARSKLGSVGYHLWLNNCEHFAYWCKTGEHVSRQLLNPLAISMGSVRFYDWPK